MTQAKVPTKAAIDKLLREYYELDAQVTADTAALRLKKAKLDELEAKIIPLVQQNGVRHAEKSMRLESQHGRGTVTTGTQNKVDDAAVGEFRGYLASLKKKGLVERFFTPIMTYQMVAAPREVLKSLLLTDQVREKVEILLGRCSYPVPKNPSLKVEYTIPA